MSMSIVRVLIVAAALAISAAAQAAEPPTDRFAADLYRQIRAGGGNRIISPASISDAFALAYPGAAGQTAAEMQRVFGFRAAGDAPRFTTGQHADGAQLNSANGLWVAEDLHLEPAYLATIRRAYGAAVETADFAHDAGAARASINRWVEAATNNRVKNLIPADKPSPETGLILINAVYMKAQWQDPFSPESTHRDLFNAPGGRAIPVPMMRQTTYQRTLKRPGFRAVEMPYRNSDLAMVILLPDARDGLRRLEAAMTPTALGSWLAALDARDQDPIDLSLPKFTIAARRPLKDDLKALGVQQAFRMDADFSKLAAAAALTIDDIIHQAFIEVDEAGTEAAAATALELVVTGARREPPPIVVRADHPFVFLIRDGTTGAILFMGRLETPEPVSS